MPQRPLNLARMLRAERRPRQQLEQMQLRKLRALLRHAFDHVPAYRELWRAHGVDPNDVERLADLGRLPIIDKDAMREMGPENFIDERLENRRGLLPRYTSGSSGKPFEFFVDESYNKWRKAQRLRPYVTNGLKPWHRVLALTYDEEQRALVTHKLGVFAERRVSAARPAHELLQIATEMRPDAITGYPSALGLLAAECIETGAVLRRPMLVFSDSEVLTPSVRAHVREAFGTDPIDVYGTFESDNMAFQCNARAGLHVAMESVIVEVVAAGAAVFEGAKGEVVVTVLHNYAMPFIRYNLHDVSAYAVSRCPCGRTLPALERVEGRNDDYIRLADGRRRSALPLLAELDDMSESVREYRVVQNGIRDFIVYLQPTSEFSADAQRRVREIVERHVPGARASLIECPAGIPRDSSGKLSAFVSALRD